MPAETLPLVSNAKSVLKILPFKLKISQGLMIRIASGKYSTSRKSSACGDCDSPS
jgi:hypothetical protein